MLALSTFGVNLVPPRSMRRFFNVSCQKELTGRDGMNDIAFLNKDGDSFPTESRKQSPVVSAAATLCGYLDKLSGPLKVWRSLWFIYEEKECQLVYYKCAQDVNPLGWIDLSNAILGDIPQADQGTFYIQTPERTFTLKAVNCESMIYWLKQLQLKRWHHGNISGKLGMVTSHHALRRYATLSDVLLRHTPTGIHKEYLLRSRSSQELSHSLSWEELWDPFLPLKDIQAPPYFDQDKSPPKTNIEPSGPKTQWVQEIEAPKGHQSSLSSEGSSSNPADKTASPQQEEPPDTASLQQEVLSLAGQVKAQKDLVSLLQKALELAQQEKLTPAVESPRSECEWKSSNSQPWNQGECNTDHSYGLQVAPLLRHDCVAESQDHLRLLAERNQAERELVLRLSQQVAESLADPQRSLVRGWTVLETQEQLRQEIRNLKDNIEAYKTQNTYLNAEIYKLTKEWRKSTEQEKCLMIKCAHLEAKVFRMESRSLTVLFKLQESRGLERHREAIKTLITDTLREGGRDILELNPAREYDEYGFRISTDIQMDDMKLLAKLQALGIHSHDPPQQQNDGEEERDSERLWGRWAQHFDGRRSDKAVASPKLKGLLRKGVPYHYRRRVWRWIVWSRTRSLRERQPHWYQQICFRSQAASAHRVSQQIWLDLETTLTGNRHFSFPAKRAVRQLHRILLAFSCHNRSVGYCQGLNRLAAMALLVLQSEEDAFWCLVAIVETIMPQDFYGKTLTASQVEQRVLKDFIAEKMPRLTAHFHCHGVDVSLVTSDWFLAAFVERLTSDVLLRIWDAFLYEGTKVIFRYALALFKYTEEDVLKIHHSVDIYQYLRFITRTITDSRRLTTIAFCDMNPFPFRLLRQRRALHLQCVHVQLSELERIQRELGRERRQHKDRELGLVSSEDEGDT
ncbi:TBC1 domain family member 2A isoform X3 [Oncorhynchus kisutch]|nr:TBC1 domain family member 2A isoform X3 [Oncorhynchus kisutch]